jgi:hypothetical protein
MFHLFEFCCSAVSNLTLLENFQNIISRPIYQIKKNDCDRLAHSTLLRQRKKEEKTGLREQAADVIIIEICLFCCFKP